MSLEAPRCATLPCVSCPFPFLELPSAGLRVSPCLCPVSCSLTMHGTGGCTAKLSPLHATRAAGKALLCMLQWCFWTQRKLLCAAASCWPLRLVPAILRKAAGSPEGTSVSVSVEKRALTHFLCTANTFTTLELPKCSMCSLVASSSPLKSLLYLYAKITNTSSVMAIFTHILYFTAVQKKCAI